MTTISDRASVRLRWSYEVLNLCRKTFNVRRVPEWFQSGDLIVKRGKRTFAVSLTQTEPRWRQWWRRWRVR